MASTAVWPYLWSQKTKFHFIYCCVTNHPKTLCLKTTTIYYFSQFYGSGIWAGLGWVVLLTIRCHMGSVIHLTAFCWCLGLAKHPTIPESVSAASPCSYLGHSMWIACEPTLAALLTSLLASKERSHHFSGLRSPRIFFLPNSIGQRKSKDSPNQGEGIEILSPCLDGGNLRKFREGKNCWGPTLETQWHK